MAQQHQNPDSQQGTQRSAPDLSDVDQLGYEQAREQLVEVVSRLEAGGTTLEESLQLWERGEALATRCEQWLDGARERLDAARARRENRDQAASDTE
ncbi:exodeoxyribonuclease VII small subunit [Kocuria sp.]|uniref:exodeoxyribonuclease VII small subunit n=1 Tax=Kocuria sp. TaxID=1871328 RepID=UPI0026DD33D0|nr:exodeoxyribonuclease VII small subunit [Kocuria sp.]MDO4918776.1 exodeoxyribonuclease VII small subunit [Kocuria sp.]